MERNADNWSGTGVPPNFELDGEVHYCVLFVFMWVGWVGWVKEWGVD